MAQPLAVAIHALDRSGARPGQSVVVVGVGGIGAFIVAAASARGISRLIAVDIDAQRLAVAASLGATTVANAADRELADVIIEATGGNGADLVIEASGAENAPAAAISTARRGGRVVLVGLQSAPRTLDLRSLTLREIDIVTTLAHVCDANLPDSLDLLARTDIAEKVIDRIISLEDLVEKGLRPLAERTAHGKIIVAPG